MIGVLMNSNKKIVLLFYFFQCNGSYTSIIDLYFNLIKYRIDVELYIILKNSSNALFFKTLCEFPKFKFNLITLERLHTIIDDTSILITTAGTVFFSYPYIKSLKYKDIIILDGSIFFTNECKNINNSEYYQKLNKYKILGNPYNKKYFKEDNNYYTYYHKFSIERLNYLNNRYSSISKGSLIRDSSIKSQFYFNMFHKYSCYKYKRCHYWDNNIYFENIGKLIFEYKYMNKKVFYSTENKTIDDGLTYYLKLFDIDDKFDQEITITPEEVIDKLGFKNNDLILELLLSYE